MSSVRTSRSVALTFLGPDVPRAEPRAHRLGAAHVHPGRHPRDGGRARGLPAGDARQARGQPADGRVLRGPDDDALRRAGGRRAVAAGPRLPGPDRHEPHARVGAQAGRLRLARVERRLIDSPMLHSDARTIRSALGTPAYKPLASERAAATPVAPARTAA